MARRYWRLVFLFLISGAVIWCCWTWWASRRDRDAVGEIDREMAAGRHATAAHHLNHFLARNPGSDEAAYLLGVCEQARGRNQPAQEAWARVTPGSPFAARAINARLALLIDSGQLAAAEQLINDAVQDARNEATAVRILLLPTFSHQGRVEDAQRLVVQRWEHLRETGEEASELAVNLARLHAELQWTPIPVEAVRAHLDQAGRLASDDDRVWLGQANLAIRTDKYEEAERLLNACLKRRPDDVPVWRARLRWAVGTSRLDVVQQALAHLPATEFTPAENHRLAAWIAAKHGATATERDELVGLIETDPTDVQALGRLAELASQDGDPQRSIELRQRQAEINRLQSRYRKLYDRNQPIRDAIEMGQLAENLGRPFEATVYLSVAAAEGFHRDVARRKLKRLRRLPAPPLRP
jgi:enediyne biosynthesis protein E4